MSVRVRDVVVIQVDVDDRLIVPAQEPARPGLTRPAAALALSSARQGFCKPCDAGVIDPLVRHLPQDSDPLRGALTPKGASGGAVVSTISAGRTSTSELSSRRLKATSSVVAAMKRRRR